MEKLCDLFSAINTSINLSTDEEISYACQLMIEVQDFDSSMRDCIKAAFKSGPLFDGDVSSKTGRDALVEAGYVTKVIVRGESGYNACTYKGAKAYKLLTAGL